MSKKKIFSTSLIVLGIALFWISPVFALGIPPDFPQDNLVVEFGKTPLFDEANFLPGESITRWVKVTNNSGSIQRIATEAINVNDPNRLGDALSLEIKEGGSRLYNGTLSQFLNTGEVYLSDLSGGGTQTQYDFIVTFYSGTNNTFQGKTVGFDILIGFQGTEGGLTPGGGGGGGGFLPPGLTITNESTEKIGAIEVIITWLTSYSSTSQVIYAKDGEKHILDLTDYSGTPPKYGYERTTPENPLKVTSHSITISSLTPGTTYYYRCVSHGSLAISTEHSFTTLGVEEVGEEVKEEEIVGEKPVEEKPAEEEIGGVEEIKKGVGAVGEEKEEGVVEEFETPELVEVGLEEPTGLGKFLATIGAFPFNLKVILIILALILIGLFILWLIKKKKERKEGSI